MNTIRNLSTVCALLAALGALSACGSDKQKDKLAGLIGPGAGGTAASPPVGTPQSPNIARPDGTVIGQYTYQDGFFSLNTSDSTLIGLLNATPGGEPSLIILISHISGRPDTPCRFNAALLARDAGLDIGDTGFRRNDEGQELYQVNLSGHGQYVQLFCADLRGNTGAQFSVHADAPDKVSWLQVYAVLNSIHAQ